MFSLGVGPWTGGATQQEVETWVLCHKSIVSVFMSVFICVLSCCVAPVLPFPFIPPHFMISLCVVKSVIHEVSSVGALHLMALYQHNILHEWFVSSEELSYSGLNVIQHSNIQNCCSYM